MTDVISAQPQSTDNDPLRYLTIGESMSIVAHYESGDIDFALPDDDGYHRISSGRTSIAGPRIADGEGTRVVDVRIQGKTEEIERLYQATHAILQEVALKRLHMSPDMIKNLSDLSGALKMRLDDRCWIVSLPDGRPLTAHWLRHDADADDSIEDAAGDLYDIEVDESFEVVIAEGQWSTLPDAVRP